MKGAVSQSSARFLDTRIHLQQGCPHRPHRNRQEQDDVGEYQHDVRLIQARHKTGAEEYQCERDDDAGQGEPYVADTVNGHAEPPGESHGEDDDGQCCGDRCHCRKRRYRSGIERRPPHPAQMLTRAEAANEPEEQDGHGNHQRHQRNEGAQGERRILPHAERDGGRVSAPKLGLMRILHRSVAMRGRFRQEEQHGQPHEHQ